MNRSTKKRMRLPEEWVGRCSKCQRFALLLRWQPMTCPRRLWCGDPLMAALPEEGWGTGWEPCPGNMRAVTLDLQDVLVSAWKLGGEKAVRAVLEAKV